MFVILGTNIGGGAGSFLLPSISVVAEAQTY
jgi:hypothetical protein